MLKTLTNSYKWIQSFANKNEVRVNEFVKTKLPLYFYFVKTNSQVWIDGKEITNFVRIHELCFWVKPLWSALSFQNNLYNM